MANYNGLWQQRGQGEVRDDPSKPAEAPGVSTNGAGGTRGSVAAAGQKRTVGEILDRRFRHIDNCVVCQKV